jgi:hypothetical protein
LIFFLEAHHVCRPDLWKKTVIGGFLFLGIYAAFMLSLLWFAPGYIGEVWNLAALSGGLIYGIPFEELLFGFAFGLYWTGAYEHFTWNMSAPHPAPGRIKRRLNSFPTLPQKETPHA